VVVRLALSSWQTVNYEERPSLGKFEGDRFDPRTWRPQTPTAAYMELRDDDAFWAALRVAAFTDETIRAIVHTGEFSDSVTEKVLGDIMVKRRNKILGTYLPAVNPTVSPRFDGKRLTFENAAVAADVAKAPESYHASWVEYDNAIGNTRFLRSQPGAAQRRCPNVFGLLHTPEATRDHRKPLPIVSHLSVRVGDDYARSAKETAMPPERLA
jgi:hypothetical protein